MNKLLIVKTSSMGDVVHALPAVSDIKAALPHVIVDWLVEERFSAIASAHAGVRRVWPMQWRQWRKQLGQRATWQAMRLLRRELRGEGYDAVLDLQGLIKSALWARQAGVPVSGYDRSSCREPLASLAYTQRAHVARDQQAIARCRQLASKLLGYPLPTSAPAFGWSRTTTWLERAPSVILIPIASRAEKLWPESHWIALAQRLRACGLAVQVTWGSAAEHERAARIATAGQAEVTPYWSVADAIAALAQVRWVVGLDTGLSHVAAAAGAATVGIYCDHDPGLAGITGAGYTTSIGGVGQCPSVQDVWQCLVDGGIASGASPLQP